MRCRRELGVGGLALLPQRTSADTTFTSFAFTATGAPTPRTMPDRLGEIKNVKDYGALGNGVTDDTAAIQECFDAAFGTYSSPHGGIVPGVLLNRPVFFPTGHYVVTSSIVGRRITGAIDDGTGKIKLTTSTTGLTSGDNINVTGMIGTTEANGSWFITVNDSTHLTLLQSAFTNTYISGGTFTTPALKLRSVQGGWIFGAGRFTTIENVSSNGAVICTNGFAFTRVENLNFKARSGGTAFQLDWMNPDPGATAALQSNTFVNCFFGGNSAYGLKIGAGQNMGSETMILNCYTGGCSVAGIYCGNYNACDNTIVGGNIAQCAIGILVQSGSLNTIHGVSFQANTTCDIYVVNGANDSYSIAGCRSESVNFLQIGASQPFNISGCNQTNASSGYFVKGAGRVTINSCSSVNGYLEGTNGHYSVINCIFDRADYLSAGAATNFASLNVIPMPITERTVATYSIASSDGGTKIKFNRATGQTVTVRKNSDTSVNLTTGTKIEVQQTGAGQTTFVGASGVTIRSANGLKLRARYSCAILTCDGTDTWTLTGDTAL